MRRLTSEETKVAYRFLYLDNAIDVLESELKGLGDGSFKIKEAYIDKVTKAIYKGQLERQELKQEMQRLEMKVEHDETTVNTISFVFFAGKRCDCDVYYRPRLVYQIRRVIYELLDLPIQEA